MMITLPSSSLDVLGNVLVHTLQRHRGLPIAVLPNEAYAPAVPTGTRSLKLAQALLRQDNISRGERLGCHALDLFHDAEVAFEWEFFAAGGAEAARNTRIA